MFKSVDYNVDDEIDVLYRQFTADLTSNISVEKDRVDQMQDRVDSITTKFDSLRTDNLENLKKTERRLSILKSDSDNPNVKDNPTRVSKHSHADSDHCDEESSDEDIPPPPEDEETDGGIDEILGPHPANLGTWLGHDVRFSHKT